MKISGVTEQRERHVKCRSFFYGQTGFTLVEVLLVVLIIGVMSGAIVFSMQPNNHNKELREESQRLYAMLRFASDEAIFTSQELGAEVFGDGYRFLVLNEGQLDPDAKEKNDGKTHEFSLDIKPMDKTSLRLNSKPQAAAGANAKPTWMPVEKDKEFRSYKLPSGFRLLLEVEERKYEFKNKAGKMPKLKGEGDEEESIDKDEGEFGKKKPEDIRPSIYFLSSGESTPFRIEVFEDGKSDIAWTIKGNELGEIEIKGPKGDE